MRFFTFFIGLLIASIASAHEHWIEPEAYQVTLDTKIKASFRNGEEFSGGQFPYFSRSTEQLDVFVAGNRGRLSGRDGDFPAIQLQPPIVGLYVFAYQSKPATLSYETLEKFAKFAAHKDFPTALDDHIRNDFPKTDFTETYTRFSKSLVAVGSQTNGFQDVETGMETELVALSNPYANASGTIDVKSLYRGAPRANAQIELFEKSPDGDVSITLHRTNAAGIAKLPVKKGHDYLVDAVVLRPATGAAAGKTAVWETLWASLTFAIPQ